MQKIHNLVLQAILIIVVPSGHLHIIFMNLPYIPNIHWEYSEIMTHLFVSQSSSEVRKTVKIVISLSLGQPVLCFAVFNPEQRYSHTCYKENSFFLSFLLCIAQDLIITNHTQCKSFEDNCVQRQIFQ